MLGVLLRGPQGCHSIYVDIPSYYTKQNMKPFKFLTDGLGGHIAVSWLLELCLGKRLTYYKLYLLLLSLMLSTCIKPHPDISIFSLVLHLQ